MQITRHEGWNQEYEKILNSLKKFGVLKETVIDETVMYGYLNVIKEDFNEIESLITYKPVEVHNIGLQLAMYGIEDDILGVMLNEIYTGGAASIGYYLNDKIMIIGNWDTTVRHKISLGEVKYSEIESLGKIKYPPKEIIINDEVNEISTGSFGLINAQYWEEEIKDLKNFSDDDKNRLHDIAKILIESCE